MVKTTALRVSTSDGSHFGEGSMDFLASSIALMESQGREVDASKVCGNMSVKQRELFNQRLTHYRQALLADQTV